MDNIILPEGLNNMIGLESKDFVVKANRAYPIKSSLFRIFFGAAWLAFTSIFVLVLLIPLLAYKEVHFTMNGVPTVASRDNLGPIVIPALFIGVFVLVGIGILAGGIISFFKKGGYFIGTPTRLIHFQSGILRSIDWEQFSGDVEIIGDNNKGSISLQLRTGRMVSRKNGPDRYVPDVISICEIPDAFDIGEICRKRIKENDPTPSTTEHNFA